MSCNALEYIIELSILIFIALFSIYKRWSAKQLSDRILRGGSLAPPRLRRSERQSVLNDPDPNPELPDAFSGLGASEKQPEG